MSLKNRIETLIREEALDLFERTGHYNSSEVERQKRHEYARGMRAAIEMVRRGFRDHDNARRQIRRKRRK